MKHLFATDLDGTLFNALHATDIFILSKLKRVLSRGDYITLATGRNMRKSHIIHDFKDVKVYTVAMNGAIILDPEYKIIYEEVIPTDVIKDMVKHFPDVRFEFIGRENVFVTFDKSELDNELQQMNFLIRLMYKRFKKLFTSEYLYNQKLEDIYKEDILKVNCNIKDSETKKYFDEYLRLKRNEIINAPYAGDTYEITKANVNKGVAIKHLAKLLNVSEKNTYVYGDGLNDVEMLKMFDNAYTPSNACIEAKKAAKYHLASNKTYSVIRHIMSVK